jgi:hypothetical protein
MKRKNSILILAILILLFFVFGYLLITSKEHKTELLNISFVSECPICENGDKVPFSILSVINVYSNKDNRIDLIPIISFKRIDISSTYVDTLHFSRRVNNQMSKKNAESMFLTESKSLIATRNMTEVLGTESKSITIDTTDINYFYLIQGGSESRLEGKKNVFTDPIALKNHIQHEIEKGRLFDESIPNKITILLRCGNGPVKTPVEDLVNDQSITPDEIGSETGEEVTLTTTTQPTTDTRLSQIPAPTPIPTPYEPKIKNVNVSLTRPDEYSNLVRWDASLVKASRLTIVYNSVSDNAKYTYDVTNNKSHVISTGSALDDMRIWNVELLVEYLNYDKVNVSNNKLTNQHFKCSE